MTNQARRKLALTTYISGVKAMAWIVGPFVLWALAQMLLA